MCSQLKALALLIEDLSVSMLPVLILDNGASSIKAGLTTSDFGEPR